MSVFQRLLFNSTADYVRGFVHSHQCQS